MLLDRHLHHNVDVQPHPDAIPPQFRGGILHHHHPGGGHLRHQHQSAVVLPLPRPGVGEDHHPVDPTEMSAHRHHTNATHHLQDPGQYVDLSVHHQHEEYQCHHHHHNVVICPHPRVIGQSGVFHEHQNRRNLKSKDVVQQILINYSFVFTL